MGDVALHHHRGGVGRGTRHAALLAATALVLGAGVLVAERVLDGGSSTVDAGPRAAAFESPVAAIATWVADERDEVFPGAEGDYLGTCPASAPLAIGICSALVEDLDDVQIHLVGPHATDWGADLLLERSDDGWAVTDVSPWPQLGTRYDGPPWSPQTALAAWWFDRAAARYGAGAVHLRSCADAAEVADSATGQPLLCSTLATSEDGERVYLSGLVGENADVRLTLVERADHTWIVTEAVEL